MERTEIANSFRTILSKEIYRYMRLWRQTLLPPVITISLYYAIFGTLIGPRIGEMQGYSYVSFIVPGLVMLSIITNAYGNVVSSFFSDKFQGSLDAIMISPTPSNVIFFAFCIGSALRGITVGIIVTIVSLAFTQLNIHNIFVLASVSILTAFMFSTMGLMNAIFARNFDDITIIPNFVLTPLTYLGGIFYSIELLPEFWQRVSLLNPIIYMVDAFRYGMLGVSDISLLISYSVIVFFTLLLSAICFYLLDRGIGIRT